MEYVWETVKELVVPQGTASLGFKIETPPAGRITRVVVKQTDQNNLVNFNVNLYSLPVVPLTPGGSPQSSVPKDNAKIMPQISATAGNAAVYMSDAKGYAFRNTFSKSFTKPDRAVYLELTLASQQSVNTNWSVTLVVIQES